MHIDVLDEVSLVLHFAHNDIDFLVHLKSEIENPVHRLEVLHLGRAEDWIVLDEVSDVLDAEDFKPRKNRDGNYRHFFWIPKGMWSKESTTPFEKVEGLLYNLPTFWSVEGFKQTLNRHGPRNFEFMRTKLNDGLFIGQSFLFDEQLKLPVFLADFEHANTN
jgi:CRISPR-associated protein Cas5t